MGTSIAAASRVMTPGRTSAYVGDGCASPWSNGTKSGRFAGDIDTDEMLGNVFPMKAVAPIRLHEQFHRRLDRIGIACETQHFAVNW
jgi:hypothetical protein